MFLVRVLRVRTIKSPDKDTSIGMLPENEKQSYWKIYCICLLRSWTEYLWLRISNSTVVEVKQLNAILLMNPFFSQVGHGYMNFGLDNES